MRDPERLIHGGATDFERLLVSSAANERPSAELGARMEEGLGGVIGHRAAGGASWAIRWTRLGLLTVVVGGLLTLGSIALLRRDSRPLSAAPTETAAWTADSPENVAPPPAAPFIAIPAPVAVRAQLVTTLPPAVADAVASRRSTTSRSPNVTAVAAPAAGDLREEILLIARVRSALIDRSAARALSGLREYGTRFPRGAFVPEATVLRVEALDLDGQHAQAVALGRRFLGAHPDSPLAERVERVTGVLTSHQGAQGVSNTTR